MTGHTYTLDEPRPAWLAPASPILARLDARRPVPGIFCRCGACASEWVVVGERWPEFCCYCGVRFAGVEGTVLRGREGAR